MANRADSRCFALAGCSATVNAWIDILGHEFTHCVSNMLASYLPYLNDSGAINEGLSDTMGNMIESLYHRKG